MRWHRYPLFLLSIVIMLVLGCGEASKHLVKKGPPNILVMIADDAGWNDVGYHGSEIRTPNIDFMAKNGVILNRFYVHPTCSPTRASFLTGRPASRMGIVAPISGKSEKKLPDTIQTLPQLLVEEGYETALFGKWHLGLKPASGPQAYGFDYSYGFLHGQIDQYTHRYKNGDASWHRNGTLITEDGHATDLIGKETIEWLTSKRDTSKRFYIQLAYSAPHFPLQEETRWKTPYRPIIADSSRVDFAAAMAHMDDNIGKVLKTLDDIGLSKNTLVIFLSDNGAMKNWFPTDQYEGRHGPNPVLGSNTPLRDWKASNFEGGIRVPALLYWKGVLAPRIVDDYLSVIDLMPTLATLSGSENLANTVEGQNIWSAFLGQGVSSKKPIYIRGHRQESIIQKPWKLVRTRHKMADPDYELFHLEEDPNEEKNRYTSELDIAKRLLKLLEEEFERDAPLVNVELR